MTAMVVVTTPMTNSHYRTDDNNTMDETDDTADDDGGGGAGGGQRREHVRRRLHHPARGEAVRGRLQLRGRHGALPAEPHQGRECWLLSVGCRSRLLDLTHRFMSVSTLSLFSVQ